MSFRSISVLGFLVFFAFLYGAFYRGPIDALPRAYEYNSVGVYDLVDPESAPEEIKKQVMRGFNIMMETKLHLPDNAGNEISCKNCHFSAGNSFGGRSNGFSLVGVVHKYPRKLESGKEYTMEERINSCFIRSLNGTALPVDSSDMQSLVAYLEWISKDIPRGVEMPWLGLDKIRSKHVPDSKNGEHLYAKLCALCHGENGEGEEREYNLSYPPLWGDESFNDDAGMNKIKCLACFLYKNMPYNDPKLTIEEALDIAAYVTSKQRPKFEPEDK